MKRETFYPKLETEHLDNQESFDTKLVQEMTSQPSMVKASEMEQAGFWARAVAATIDIIIVSFVALLGASLADSSSSQTSGETESISVLVPIVLVAALCMSWLYYAIMESSSRQATLGKLVCGIIVVDRQGNRLSFIRATGRTFAKIPSTVVLFIGFIMIAFTKKKQGLHDMIVDTFVVHKK